MLTRPGLAREAAGVSPPAWKKEKVSQAESGKLRRRTGRTVAGLLLTDNLSVLEEQAGGREEVDNLTFVDRTDMATDVLLVLVILI